MIKKYLCFGLILVFIFSSFSNIVLSNNSNQSVDGPMDSPWPMQGYDQRHTGRSPYSTENNTGVEIWRFKTDEFGWIIGGTVIDNDGTIYFGTNDDHLYAVNNNGTLKWKFMTNGNIKTTPAIDENGIIYVGSFDAKLYAIYSNGTLKWSFSSGGVIDSSITIGDDGTIYFGNDLGVYAVNPNGTEKWFFSKISSIFSTPAIDDYGTIYASSFDGYFFAISEEGILKWQVKLGGTIRGSPLISNNDIVYIECDGELYAIFMENGTKKWEINIGMTFLIPSLGEDGTIYVGTSNYRFYAINPDGSIKWEYDPGESSAVWRSSAAISADGTIYFGTHVGYDSSYAGDIIALNPDGSLKWRKRIANLWIESSPSIAEDGTVFIGSLNEGQGGGSYGYLHAFGSVESNEPPDIPIISGETNGNIREEYYYLFNSIDPDNNPVSYIVEWGDYSTTETRNFASGEEGYASHTYLERGDYTIRVKAKDVMGAESDWATLEVTMPKNKANIFPQELDDNVTIDIKGGIGITIEIKNNGNTSISLVNWSIVLECPILLFGWQLEGAISELSPGVIETTRAGVLGFGSVTITVQVNDIIESRNGFIIGPFVLLTTGGI